MYNNMALQVINSLNASYPIVTNISIAEILIDRLRNVRNSRISAHLYENGEENVKEMGA